MPDLTLLRPTAPTALEALVDDYLAHCRARGLRVATVDNSYGRALRLVFLPWCGEHGVTEPGQLTSRLLDRFTTHLLDHGGRRGPLARTSVHSYSRTVNHFLTWAEKEGEMAPARAQLPKLPHKIIEVLSREEIAAMEAVVPPERDKIIVRLLADSGIRLGELLALRVGDLLEPRRGEFVVKVQGKGERERLVPVAPLLFRRLRRYAERGRREARGDRLFVALRANSSGACAPLTPSGVQQLVRNAAVAAGIARPVHPHLFRHSFATHALRKGMSVVHLQRILGHADLSMITAVYQHLDTSDDYAAMMHLLID